MMEWIQENPLLFAGAAGFLFFLLAGLITAAVLKRKRRRIERAVYEEYEESRGYSAVS